MKRPLPVAFRACSLPSRKGEVDAAMRDADMLLNEDSPPKRVQVVKPIRHAAYTANAVYCQTNPLCCICCICWQPAALYGEKC